MSSYEGHGKYNYILYLDGSTINQDIANEKKKAKPNLLKLYAAYKQIANELAVRGYTLESAKAAELAIGYAQKAGIEDIISLSILQANRLAFGGRTEDAIKILKTVAPLWLQYGMTYSAGFRPTKEFSYLKETYELLGITPPLQFRKLIAHDIQNKLYWDMYANFNIHNDTKTRFFWNNSDSLKNNIATFEEYIAEESDAGFRAIAIGRRIRSYAYNVGNSEFTEMILKYIDEHVEDVSKVSGPTSYSYFAALATYLTLRDESLVDLQRAYAAIIYNYLITNKLYEAGLWKELNYFYSRIGDTSHYNDVHSLVDNGYIFIGKNAPDYDWSQFLSLANKAFDRDRYALAAKYYEAELERNGSSNAATYVQCLHRLGYIAEQFFKLDEAERLYLKLIDFKTLNHGVEFDINPQLNNLANIYMQQKRFNEAEALHLGCYESRKANFGHDTKSHALLVARSASNLARLYTLTGKEDKARLYMDEALRLRTKFLDADDTVLCATQAQSGRLELAADSERGETLIHNVEEILDNRFILDLSKTTHKNYAICAGEYGMALSQTMGIKANAEIVDKVFRYSQLNESGDTATSIVLKALWGEGKNNIVGEYLLSLKHKTLAEKEFQRTRSEPTTPEAINASHNLKKAQGEYLLKYDCLLQESKDHQVKSISVNMVRNQLKPDEAFILYRLRSYGAYAVVITSKTAKLINLNTSYSEVKTLTDSLQASLGFDTFPLPRFPYKDAKGLYDKVMAPVIKEVGKRNRLIIRPYGPLMEIPLSILVRNTNFDATNTVTIPWLIRDYAISYTPSVAAFYLLRSLPPVAVKKPFIGFGDPIFDAKAVIAANTRGLPKGVSSKSYLPRLPETGDELHAISQELGGTDDMVFLAERDTETNLAAQDLKNLSVLSFATHAIQSNVIFDEPALLMTTEGKDGLLTTTEIAKLDLDVDWVILSACNTAASFDESGEVYSGLAKSFFEAGARSVLISHWNVDSPSTTKLMVSLFKKHNNLTPKDKLLQQAKLNMLDSSDYSHPSYWAPFTLIGDSRPLAR